MLPILRRRDGTTAIEYAFIALLISIAAVAALNTVGSDVAGFFRSVATSFP